MTYIFPKKSLEKTKYLGYPVMLLFYAYWLFFRVGSGQTRKVPIVAHGILTITFAGTFMRRFCHHYVSWYRIW